MNTAIFSPSGGSAGIGFAIPIDTVKYIVETLIRDGKVIVYGTDRDTELSELSADFDVDLQRLGHLGRGQGSVEEGVVGEAAELELGKMFFFVLLTFSKQLALQFKYEIFLFSTSLDLPSLLSSVILKRT